MTLRFVQILPVAAVALALAGPASAQVRAPDASPYPVEPETPAAVPSVRASARSHAKPKPQAVAQPKPATKDADKEADATPLPSPKPALAGSQPAGSKPAEVKQPAAAEAAEKPGPRSADAFAGIPQDERLKLQAALLWSGDYTGAVNGEDPMQTAIRNFQKRSKSKVTGQLTPQERATLLTAARDHEQEFGWSVVADPATGIRIGLPTKLVPQARSAARGTRWSSRHGEVQVETFRLTGPDLKLSDLFEQQKKEPVTRKVEYSTLRDDSFFISGLQGLKKFSVRATMRNGEVRGFTMMFDQAMEGIVAPVMVAMASAFSPFPQHSAPFASLSKSVEYGNGLIVSAKGHILTDARLTQSCQVLVAAGLGDAEQLATDRDHGLALLRVYGPRKFRPMAVPAGSTKVSDITVTGIPGPGDNNDGRKLAEVKARIVEGGAIELRQPVPMAGLTGAAAIDHQGRLAGIAQMRNAVLASTEPAAPPVRLVRTETIRGFLDAHSVPTPAAANTDAAASIVRVICVRK